MKRLILAFAFLLSLSALARAEESCANVANTATTVLAAADNKGNALLCQNVGATNAVTCSVGGTPIAVQHGFLLAANGGNMTLLNSPVTTSTGGGQSRIPGGIVSCITASSTSYTCCTSW